MISFRSMRILGIESSCDETALAVIEKQEDRLVIEKQALASQIAVHAQYGGVVPEVAAREHAQHIFPLLKQLSIETTGKGIDAIAVTSGPGLIPALRIGVELAKTLAWVWNKPLVAVNHLEGHVYSVWIHEPLPMFPALCLLVSGGHTELLLMRDHGRYELIGMTRDDAAGEAFDKVAKLLGLSYPGGPEISRLAIKGNASAINFPRPMLHTTDGDFSFSGLKTAVRKHVESCVFAGRSLPVADIAASFQQAIVDVLVEKTRRAVHQFQPRSVILSGGVSANRLLRNSLASELRYEFPSLTFHVPDVSLTGDNAIMIAIAGAFRFEKGETVDPLHHVADANMRLA